jgi:hypothetical protein
LIALTTGLVMCLPGTALAVPETPENCQAVFTPGSQELTTTCHVDGSEKSGADGAQNAGSRTSRPSCELRPPATFCLGTSACYIRDGVVPYAPPKSAPPKPDAQWVVRVCTAADGTSAGEAIWLTDDAVPVEPPLIVQARDAVGQLPLTRTRIVTDPPARSVVGLETYFSPADEPRVLRGTSAFGLVAVATPAELIVETGENGGTEITCDVPVTQRCMHVYGRSSVGQARAVDGQPAYGLTARTRWRITYEQGGEQVDIPDAPTAVTGPPATTLLPVAEIQSVVTRDG